MFDGQNSVSTSSSAKCDNYYQLLEAFKETHEEVHRLTLSNNRLKSKNNWLKNRVKVFEEDLNNSKTIFSDLEMIYQNSSSKCKSGSCKNCESLQKKFFFYLVKTVDRIFKGKSNFENVLASQNCIFGKSGLGLTHKARTVAFQNLFQPLRKINQLKSRNNLWFLDSTVRERVILSGFAKFANFRFLKVS